MRELETLGTNYQKAARSGGIPFHSGALELFWSGSEVQGILLAPWLYPNREQRL